MKSRGKAIRFQHKQCQTGLSVLELLIALTAIAIVVLITVPGSTMLLEKYRLKATSNELLSALELAKSEAGLRHSNALMCPSSNGHSCRSDGNWNHGWLVFSDGNGNGTAEEIELIRAYKAPNQNVNIMAQGAVQSLASFTMTGLVAENGAQTGLFKICIKESKSPPRVLNVDADGWIRLNPTHNEVCETG